MKRATDSEINVIIEKAFNAAREAEAAYREKHGEPTYCGFAWVNIKPGNCRLANVLKKLKLARKSYDGGVDVWNPGKSGTQSMDIKEHGAAAFAAVCREAGFNANARSRAD